MTEAERRKWKWVKPLSYAIAYGIQTPLIWLLKVPFVIVAVPLTCFTAGIVSLGNTVVNWLAIYPFNAIIRKLGFFELYNKARKEQE
jgi:hypothetical protein